MSPVIHVPSWCRRGPAQAKFTNTEIKEFGEMDGTDCIVAPDELARLLHRRDRAAPEQVGRDAVLVFGIQQIAALFVVEGAVGPGDGDQRLDHGFLVRLHGPGG